MQSLHLSSVLQSNQVVCSTCQVTFSVLLCNYSVQFYLTGDYGPLGALTEQEWTVLRDAECV